MMIDDPNPFDGCSLDEVLALTFDLAGADGLKALIAKTKLDRESLTAASDKLSSAGLAKGAELVRAAAAQEATRASMEVAKIREMDDAVWQKARLAELYRRGQAILEDMHGFPPEAVEFAARSRAPRKAR